MFLWKNLLPLIPFLFLHYKREDDHLHPLPQSCMEEARPTDDVRIEVEDSLGDYVGMKVPSFPR